MITEAVSSPVCCYQLALQYYYAASDAVTDAIQC